MTTHRPSRSPLVTAPNDLAAIRALAARHGWLAPAITRALCDEVEALRRRVGELEGLLSEAVQMHGKPPCPHPNSCGWVDATRALLADRAPEPAPEATCVTGDTFVGGPLNEPAPEPPCAACGGSGEVVARAGDPIWRKTCPECKGGAS